MQQPSDIYIARYRREISECDAQIARAILRRISLKDDLRFMLEKAGKDPGTADSMAMISTVYHKMIPDPDVCAAVVALIDQVA